MHNRIMSVEPSSYPAIQDPLERFALPTRTWFRTTFGMPTQVQIEAWDQIEKGKNALVIAPTGSGKTLAAFLHSIDRLMREPDESQGVRVLYVSPLKALGVDVERNLKAPLTGITTIAVEQGVQINTVRVGVRSGDTPSTDRKRLTTHPPQILITTPESLFLMLSSAASAILTGIDTVILDEVHYLAGTKRGAHLALSLERVEAMSTVGGFQRIGLSATVRPPEVVAKFLGGTDREVVIVAPETTKNWQLDVVVAVEDMTQLAIPVPGESAGAFDLDRGSPTDREMRRMAQMEASVPQPSIWPHVESMIFDLVMSHTSTICFCNSRGVAEKLTTHLNTLYHERAPGDIDGVIARTHHGSISKALRAEIESDLKQGRLPCVVATNSLELGIDMGAVDLVIQVGAPPSVASGLQRIGRGGHQVSAISHGVLLPLSRSDLLTTTVVTDLMTRGKIEKTHRLVNPLDVLAQQILSMCLDIPQTPHNLLTIIRRSDAFSDLPDVAFTQVVDMLTGKYPSDDFSELLPRLIWDAEAGTLVARPGVRRLVTTSGGTIPDRGLYGVFMAGDDSPNSGKRAVSRRVGELDEEMVYESRVGDIFTLGTSAWRIDEINANQVIVTPVPGQTGRLPFWHGDEMSRSAEVGHEIQSYVSELETVVESPSVERVIPPVSPVILPKAGSPSPDQRDGAQRQYGGDPGSVRMTSGVDQMTGGLDQWAYDNLLTYVREQKAATSVLPDDRTILVEVNKDEMGAWRACIHCQLGKAVLRPWSMAIGRRIREVHGPDVTVYVTDDGITIRLGEVENPSIASLLSFGADEIEQIVAEETTHSALFAAHFRQCAARALLLPKKDPGKRTPLWQQRLRSSHLLGVAASYPNFPIIAEALRECLDDVFDMDSLRSLMRDIASQKVQIVEVETPRPSPFAASLLFGYTGAFIYDGDQPLAERAAAASIVDPELLAALLGNKRSESMDEEVLAEVEASLQRTAPNRRASTKESFWDMLREVGPLTEQECIIRCSGDASVWLEDLAAAGRIVWTDVAGKAMAAVSGDGPLLESLKTTPDGTVVRRLVTRWVRSHTVVTADQISFRYGIPIEQVTAQLDDLVDVGEVRTGRFVDKDAAQYISVDIAQRVTRRTVVGLRAKVKPVDQTKYASFLVRWHELDHPEVGADSVVSAVDSLAGYPVPASMLESVVLPGRVTDYQTSMLDQVMIEGEVTWTGHGGIGGTDGWICLWPGDMDPQIRPVPLDDLSMAARSIHERLQAGGAWTIESLATDQMAPPQVETAIWELVWAGRVSSDTLAPVRALTQGQGALRRPHVPRPRRVRPGLGLRMPPPTLSHNPARMGRWFALPEMSIPETSRLVTAVNTELMRYGILTKGSVLTEEMTPSYFDVYKVLSAMETQGVTRRGYFIEGLGAAQFAVPGAVDRLREEVTTGMVLLAACDPANPWGAGLAWPDSMGHRPARKAGAIVVLDDGWPVIYMERGARTLVTFGADSDQIVQALRLVGDWIDHRWLNTVTITRVNSDQALSARAWAPVFDRAGFTMTPQGFRRRPT